MVSQDTTMFDNEKPYDNLRLRPESRHDHLDDESNLRSCSTSLSCRSTSTTPVCSMISSTDDSTLTMSETDNGRLFEKNTVRPSRSYRIIDGNVSQKIMQKLVAEKLAAAQLTERTAKSLRRKYSDKVSALIINQSLLMIPQESRIQSRDSSKNRKSFDLLRTSSFRCRHEQQFDSNRNSLPLNIATFDISDSGILGHQSSVRSQSSSGPPYRMSIPTELLYSNGTELITNDADMEAAAQRLSFVSSSTGYSSARSSLRSSEISDDPSTPHNFGCAKRLLTRETSRSEEIRAKLIDSGLATQLDRIAIELLETERTYVNDLNDVIQGYLNFLIDHRDDFHMTVDDISSTFGCIERIFRFNRHLYHELDATQLNVVQIAKVFTDNLNGFNDYVTYCTNYQKMVDTLSGWLKNERIAETLRNRQTVLGHSLPLNAYLLKPVQRVLKYHLFLENMLKNTTDCRALTDGDQAVIRHALNSMTSQAEKINEEKKRSEHVERVRELQTALQRWCSDEREDLCKYGDLLLEATFKLAGTKTNRQLFLFEEMLLIVKERAGALICKDYIMANSMDQKRRWMKELKRMMLDHYTVKIPEKTKMLMLSMDDDIQKSFSHITNMAVVKSNRKIPKYLEKRRKSIESNQMGRGRSQMHKQCVPGSRKNQKSSSMGNLMNEFETLSVANSNPKITTQPQPSEKDTKLSKPCTSSSLNDAASSTAIRNGSSSSHHRHKPNNETSWQAAKDSETKIPQPILKENYRLSKRAPNNGNQLITDSSRRCTYSESDGDAALSRSVAEAKLDSSSLQNDALKNHFEDSVAGLYRELQLLMQNAESLDKNDGEAIDGSGVCRRGMENLASSNRCFAKSMRKPENSQKTQPEAMNPVDKMVRMKAETSAARSAIESDSEAFMNGSAFGRTLQGIYMDESTESEVEDELQNVISWAESPIISEKFRCKPPQNIHHRRRSSQVAEQVFRLRQKQQQQQQLPMIRTGNCCIDAKAVLPLLDTNKIAASGQVHLSNRCTQRGTNLVSSKLQAQQRQSAGASLGRQRTPLTPEQCVELYGDHHQHQAVQANTGIVRNMIRQLEKPQIQQMTTAYRHLI